MGGGGVLQAAQGHGRQRLRRRRQEGAAASRGPTQSLRPKGGGVIKAGGVLQLLRREAILDADLAQLEQRKGEDGVVPRGEEGRGFVGGFAEGGLWDARG
jgi:hypothetical protein